MSRIERTFRDLKSNNKKALICFVTAGDPNEEWTIPILDTLVEGGVDILEIGIPFTDPEAEGPSIQASSERGLSQGMTLVKVLELVGGFRKDNGITPVVLMGYLNSILAMGIEHFAEKASRAGVDGLILVNLPPEEADQISVALSNSDINLIFLVAPTTTKQRAQMIAEHASGFIYYVSLKGITGANHLQIDSVAENVGFLREISSLPIAVGFGIKNAESAAAISKFSDGVVVGSRLVDLIAEHSTLLEETRSRLLAEVTQMREAIDET